MFPGWSRCEPDELSRDRLEAYALTIVDTPDGEHTALVDQLNGQAVQLRLADYFNRLRAERIQGPLHPGLRLLAAHCIVEAEHGDGVADCAERLQRLRSDTLGG